MPAATVNFRRRRRLARRSKISAAAASQKIWHRDRRGTGLYLGYTKIAITLQPIDAMFGYTEV